MDWEIAKEVIDGFGNVSDKELVKDNQTGSFIGGGVALAAGVAMGITSLPLAVPLLIAGGALGGATGEKGIKATGQAVTGFFGELIKGAESFSEEVTKRVGDIKDFLKSDEDFILRGLERLKTGDYTGAITDFTKAIDINPNRADAYFFRGSVYSDERNYNNAIADYTKAIEIDHNYIEAYLNRAHIYGFRGNERKAIDDYGYVINHDHKKSDDLDIYMKRGVLFFQLGEFEKSIRDYSKAITINPNYFDAVT